MAFDFFTVPKLTFQLLYCFFVIDIAERWIGSCRREILDHVIALDERHLLRLMREYVSYHHQDRIHDSLEKGYPGQTGYRTEAGRDCEGDLTAATLWPAPSLHLARSSVAALRDVMALRSSS